MQAAIFDMDGTLIDSMGYWRSVALEFLEEKGYDIPPELRQWVRLNSVRSTPAKFRQYFDIPETDAQMNAFFDARMAEHYRHDIGLKPHALDYLAKLRGQGVTCVLATATWRTQTIPLMEKLGALKYFYRDGREYIVCRDEMGMMKSSDDYYPTLCARFALRPDECVMFEDALYSMLTASRAGLHVWAIDDPTALPNRERIAEVAERRFAGWEELLERS